MKPIKVFLASLFLCGHTQAATYLLQTHNQDPIYQTPLPVSVYLQSRAFDLGDLSIQNAAGESLPFVVLPYADTHPQPTSIVEPLKYFALQPSQMVDSQALSVAIQAQSGNIKIETSGASSNNVPPVYLADLGEKHAPIQALEFAWEGANQQLISIEILASNDLKSWHPIGEGVLLHGTQTRIALETATNGRYLQIKPSQAFSPTQINVERTAGTPKPEIMWQPAKFLTREQTKNGQINLDFESPSMQTAQYLDVKLPDDNTITQATVLVRNDENAPWQSVLNTALYRTLKAGKPYTHAPIPVYRVARYWRLQFNQQSGGIGQQNPRLVLGWLADTLIWNARGQAPFSLHVGEGLKPNHVQVRTLLPQYQTSQPLTLPVANLTITDIQDGMTIQQLNPTENGTVSSPWSSAPDYKRWLLWSGLLLGVLLLGGMVRALLKNKTN